MSTFFQKVKDSILGGGKGGKTATDSETGVEAYADSTAADGQSASEAQEVRTQATLGKRALEDSGNQEASRTTNRRTSSVEHERRLTGHFHTPATAKAISVPTYDSFYAPLSQSSMTAQKMGGYRPMNTLNATLHASRGQAKGQRVSTPYAKAPRREALAKRTQAVEADPERSLRQLLTLEASKGGNVRDEARDYGGQGEGFSDRPNAAKRRKTGHPNGTNVKVNGGTVDLTDGDDDMDILEAPVARVNGLDANRFRKPAPVQKVEEVEDPFESDFVQRQHERTNGAPPPKHRRLKGDSQAPSRSSQQPPTRSPSVVSQTNPRATATQPGSRQSPVQINESEGSVQSAAQKNSKAPNTNTNQRRSIPRFDAGPSGSSNRPSIDLEKGFDEIAHNVKSGGKKDIRRSGGSLLRNKQTEVSEEQVVEQLLHEESKAARKQRPSGSGGGITLGTAARKLQEQRQQKRSASPPSLARTFQRDESSALQAQPQTKKLKRTAAMQTESRRPQPVTSSMDDSLESVDPLQGAATMPSKARRSVSPITYAPSKSQAASPSDLKTTNFKHSSATKSKSKEPQGFSDASQEDDLAASEMTVLAFYAASFCSSAGGTAKALVYNEGTRKFELNVGGKPAQFSDAQCVTLDLKNVDKIFHTPGSGHVFLKGPIWGVSGGNMCIAFEDYDGVGWLMSIMSSLSNVPELAPTLTRWSSNQLEKTFSTQAKALQDAFNLKRSALPAQLYNGISRLKDTDEDDEQIRYEPDEEEPVVRPNRRKAMQGGEQHDIHAVQRNNRLSGRQATTISPYFGDSAATRRSTRERKVVAERPRTPTPERWTQTHGLPTWYKPVEYPVKGVRRVTVDVKDLECLDEGQFLNDNIISFALRKIEEEIAPEYRDQVHFFNSFFYTSMSTKSGKKVFNYEGVKKWTKNKDLFAMPFVVVPINIDLHWILAIVCNLDKMGKQPSGDLPVEPPSAEPAAATEISEQQDDSLIVVGEGEAAQETKAEESAMKHLSLSDNDDDEKEDSRGDVFDFGEDGKITSQDGEDDSASSRPRPATRGKKGAKGKRKSGPPVRTFSPDAPTIILLDSFGNNHPRESGNLKEYVVAEAKDKRDLDLDQKDIQGLNAKGLPQQSNFCDCGVFLIGYVEAFAADPRGFVERIMARKLNKAADFEGWSPVAKRAQMREDLIKLYTEQEEARRDAKRAKAHAGVPKAGVSAAKGEEQVAPTSGGPASKASTPKVTPSVSKASTPAREQAKPEVAVKPTSKAASSTVKADAPAARAAKQKTPLSTEVPPPVKTSLKDHGNNNDEDDDLETEAPRPLQMQRTAAVTNRHGNEFNGSISAADEDDEHENHDDDEMLDKGPGIKPATTTAPNADAEADIFSSLKEQLHKDEVEMAQQKVFKTKAVPPHRKRRSPSTPRVERQQQPATVVEDGSQRSAVVRDSQEGGSVVCTGTRNVFHE